MGGHPRAGIDDSLTISPMLSFKSIASLAALCLLPALAAAQQQPIVVEHGIYQVHLLLHAIGSEEYSITDARDGHHVLTTSTNTDDRGPKRSSVSTRTFGDHFDPLKLEQNSGDVQSTTEISGVKAAVRRVRRRATS
jgi:hypothetical protein